MSTEIKSETVLINASTKEVFDFITDFNNIIQLLPQDKISDWKSTYDDCSFKIQKIEGTVSKKFGLRIIK